MRHTSGTWKHLKSKHHNGFCGKTTYNIIQNLNFKTLVIILLLKGMLVNDLQTLYSFIVFSKTFTWWTLWKSQVKPFLKHQQNAKNKKNIKIIFYFNFQYFIIITIIIPTFFILFVKHLFFRTWCNGKWKFSKYRSKNNKNPIHIHWILYCLSITSYNFFKHRNTK